MRKPVLFLLAFLAPLLTGLAFAQNTTPGTPDLGAWFASTAALAGIVAAVVAFLKTHVFKNIDGVAVIALSLVTGAVFGFAGHLLGYVQGGTIAGVAFGLSAGLLASGGWDALQGLISKREAAPSLEE